MNLFQGPRFGCRLNIKWRARQLYYKIGCKLIKDRYNYMVLKGGLVSVTDNLEVGTNMGLDTCVLWCLCSVLKSAVLSRQHYSFGRKLWLSLVDNLCPGASPEPSRDYWEKQQAVSLPSLTLVYSTATTGGNQTCVSKMKWFEENQYFALLQWTGMHCLVL